MPPAFVRPVHLARADQRLTAFCAQVLAAATDGFAAFPLGELVVDIRYGTSTKCAYAIEGRPVLRIPNVRDGRIDTSDLKFAVDSAIALTPTDRSQRVMLPTRLYALETRNLARRLRYARLRDSAGKRQSASAASLAGPRCSHDARMAPQIRPASLRLEHTRASR